MQTECSTSSLLECYAEVQLILCKDTMILKKNAYHYYGFAYLNGGSVLRAETRRPILRPKGKGWASRL